MKSFLEKLAVAIGSLRVAGFLPAIDMRPASAPDN
jgi:hypothetical protein